MFHHRLDEELQKTVSVKWYFLAFLSGSVNAGGFLAFGRFVTHVTGFATLFGMHVARANYDQAFGIAMVPAVFLLGSIISAYLVDRRYHRGHPPHYDWVMFLVFLCLTCAAAGGYFNLFGGFGEEVRLRQDFALLALLSLASGLQNAAITTSSGASVRTTHLTGITTDLGIGIVRALATAPSNPVHRSEVRANWRRIGTITAFIAGSVSGAMLFLKIQYLGFLLPAGIALYAVGQARLEFKRTTAELAPSL